MASHARSRAHEREVVSRAQIRLREAAHKHGERPGRAVLSDYQGMGSQTSAFAIRHARFKHVNCVTYPPQLFDLDADPHDICDLAGDPRYRDVLRDYDAILRSMLDPAAVDRRVEDHQYKQLARNGGAEAVIARGDLGFSLPPGVDGKFNQARSAG